MITALLAAVLTGSLLAGHLPGYGVLILSLFVAVGFRLKGHHHHDGVLSIDGIAHHSRLCGENAFIKVGGSVALLFCCLCSPSPWPPVCLFFFLAAATVLLGGIRLHDYVSLMGVPVVFLLLSALTLLWDFAGSAPKDAILSVPLFGGFLIVEPASQVLAAQVLARALGAVGCLFFLSLSTPLPDILLVLRRIKVPVVVIDVALLMYRYIFLLLRTARERKQAAASRFGYGSWRKSLRTTGLVYAGLLAHSFRRASACFDAMESRCYTGSVTFLTETRPITKKLIALIGVPLGGMLICLVLLW